MSFAFLPPSHICQVLIILKHIVIVLNMNFKNAVHMQPVRS